MSGDLFRGDVTPVPKAAQLERPAGAVKRTARRTASPTRKAQIRDRKAQACRCCGVSAEAMHIHMHHLVKRGAPYFGDWTENNIVGLCGDCHHELHTQNTERIRKILRASLTEGELKYGDMRAYEGYFDDVLWRMRPVVTSAEFA